ncbi:ranBP-type and C3HC4-type zinc finger-containing protein 1-like [Aedes albopictus]|uniref:Ubiquitin conjugating enzyme 7 n=1 Tax=Aedes albopictus TaxID=7160 RepID=A0ABM1YJW2_AEDAL
MKKIFFFQTMDSKTNSSPGSHYEQLLSLTKNQEALIRNVDPSLCHLCDAMTCAGSGVVLADCLHTYCTDCLRTSLLGANTTGCPYPRGKYECVGNLEQRELEVLLNAEEYRALMGRKSSALRDIANSLEHATGNRDNRALPADLDLLLTLTDGNVVPNPEPFECPICFAEFKTCEGVILHDCFHCFCRECLANSIKHADDVVVRCPYKDRTSSCETEIQDREIRTLLSPDDYGIYLKRSLKQAESSTANAFHCKTPECDGWCILDDQEDVTVFLCPLCDARSCLLCDALHPVGMTCEDYNDRLDLNPEGRLSIAEIDNMLAARTARRCPKCRFVLTKNGGCNNIVCGKCKLELRWD